MYPTELYPDSSAHIITFSGPKYPDDRKTTKREQEPRISQEILTIRNRIAGISNPDTIPSFTLPRNNNLTEPELIEEQRHNKKRADRERQQEAQKQKEQKEKSIKKEVTKRLFHQTNRIKDFSKQTSSLLSQYAQEDKTPCHITKRATYLKKYYNDPTYYYESTAHSNYSNNQTKSLLEEHNIDTGQFYEEFFGNHLQHGIHEEYLSIISHTTTIKFDTNHCQLRSFIVLAVQTSRDNNVKGNCVTSLEINDICHHLLNPIHHGSLAGQIAHLQTTIKYYESSHWKKALDYLEETALYDQEIRACLNAVKKFSEQFETVNCSQYNLQVIDVMQQLGLNELHQLTAQQQFEMLEKHHEAIAIKTLRALKQQNKDKDLPIFSFVVSIFKLDNPHNERNTKLIDYLLYHNDYLGRVRELTNTTYNSSHQKNPFLTDQGILKEHAIIAELNSLPIPPLDRLKTSVSTHDFLYTYCTTKKPENKKLAHYGLYHSTYAATNPNSERSKSHELLASKYHKTLYTILIKNEKLLEWCDNLACHYRNAYQQEVHDELVWLANYYIDTQEKNIQKDEITRRLLDNIEDKLTIAHVYNQNNQPEKSHALIVNIVNNFDTLPKENQKTSDIFQPLNLIDISRSISDTIQANVAHIKIHTWLNDYNPEEKIEYSAHELSKMQIQHGKLIRHADSSQKRPDPANQPLYASEVLGFCIKADANTIDIGYVSKNDLDAFKEHWPVEELVGDVFNLWLEEIPLYSAGSQAAAYERFVDRYNAYQETKNNPYVFVERTYSISQEVQQLLDKNEIDSNHLKAGTYNSIQHQLHTELIDILEQTTSLDAHQEISDLLRSTNTMMLDFISTAAYENKNGNILRTWTILDFCWATLDCSQAVWEGIKEGGYDAATYALHHPGEIILFTVAGKFMFYYQTAKLARELGLAAYDYLSKTPKEREKAMAHIQFRDIVKAASSIGTQLYVNHKMNPVITKYVDALHSKLPDKLFLESKSLWSKKQPVPVKSPQTAQVQIANGEKIEVALHNESFNQVQGSTVPPSKARKGSGSKQKYTRPSPEEIAQQRANKKLQAKNRKERAIESLSEKSERIKQQKVNTIQNLKDAQKCNIHKYEAVEETFLKHLSPHAEFLYKKFGIRIKGIDYYHHMEKDFNQNTKNYSGFHSARNHPEFVFEVLEGSNEHGFENIIVGNARKIKKTPTSLYPKNWDEITIGQKVIEGLLSGEIHKSKGGILEIHGKAQNYLSHKGIVPFDITIFLEPSGMIRSSFPQLDIRK